MNAQSTNITVNATLVQANDFMEKLAEDDTFRDRLAADPKGVLAEYGVDFTPADDVPEHVTLPPKEEVQGLRRDMGLPNESGTANPEALGRAVYVMLFKWGFGAMPFIAPNGR